MTPETTPPGATGGTQHWFPSGPELDEVRATRRWTIPDATLGEDYGFGELRRGDLLPGTRLRVEGWLGEGTTAVVYRGQHVDLGRPLAIKVLKDAGPDDKLRDRFLAEARVTSELDSEYVVDVIDFGRLEDGRLYYAMAYLEGQPLDELLDDGAMPVARVLPLLRMACKGLQQAHDKGVVHRDIKPENMMVVKRRNGEQLVIVDFGIATSSGSSGGRVCGTPYTMAPEQIEGKAVDARTDVYALGCCAFQMLTGKPFANGTTLTATLARHLSNERAEIDATAGVPKAIARVIHRCLALDPADRYASASELEAALCEAQIAAGIGEVGIHLAPPEVDEPRRTRISSALARPRRKPRVIPAGLAGVAGGVMMSLVGGWIAHSPEREPAPMEIVASEPRVLDASDVVIALAGEAPEPAAPSDASVFSFTTLSERAGLDEVVPEPTQKAKPRSRTRPRHKGAVTNNASPAPERSRASLFGFRDDEGSSWGTRSRARKLVREGDRARRHGEVARASDLYRRAAKLGSRRADDRLEDLGKTG